VHKKPGLIVKSTSEDETLECGRLLGAHLRGGDWLSLVGDLGTGKTVFVKGLGKALHCEESPRSPTFVLIQTYRPRRGCGLLSLHHVDLYRLETPEIPYLAWDELQNGNSVTVVEWAEKAQGFWPEDCLVVSFHHQGEDERLIKFFARGSRFTKLIKELRKRHEIARP